ncbi:MAG: transcription termination factor NusA [Patescibacteria group bacterium]
MFDLKVLNSALSQLEEERGIPKEKILEAIEQALAAAYKKDYGKKGQIIRAKFDHKTGKVEFTQIKIVVSEETVRMPDEEIKEGEDDTKQRFSPEHDIMILDAKKIKKDAVLDDEIVFPLEAKDDYGRIAAQTAKQVIIQKIREAEKVSILGEYSGRKGEIVNGIIQRMERGNVFVDLGRVVGIIPFEEQIPGERYHQGARIKAYVYEVEDGQRGINVKLSRSHPDLLKKLFEIEAPEIANGVVEIKAVAREAGARSKIAVASKDSHVDPIGSCVGQRGVRVSTVMNELSGEKIDIIGWSEDPQKFVTDALSPAKVSGVEINNEERLARVKVSADQFSLAIGRGGQNVRLAAKLTGYKIDIVGIEGESIAQSDGENVSLVENSKETSEKTAEILDKKTGDDKKVNPEAAEKEEAQNK